MSNAMITVKSAVGSPAVAISTAALKKASLSACASPGHHQTRFTRSVLLLIVLNIIVFTLQRAPLAAQRPQMKYEDNEVYMRLVIRSPEQLAAFYHGREFNQASIEKILETCFITPIIKNKSLDVLWLELDQWEFRINGQSIQRIKRDYWPDKWREVQLPQAHQSTFGWTLMPEVRDLRLDEGVGGSVVIPMQSQPFTMKAVFPTGMDKKGRTKTILFEGLTCPSDNAD